MGLETALALTLALVRVTACCDRQARDRAAHDGPARAFGLPGRAPRGRALPADVTVVDPKAEWTVDARRFYSKSRNTPFQGKSVQGRVTSRRSYRDWRVFELEALTKGCVMKMARAVLALADGTLFEGQSFGCARGRAWARSVFNTSMTGYQEILTDPSYVGQIVTMSCPEMGNVGINSTWTRSPPARTRWAWWCGT